MAQTFALIAPVHLVLHQVSCSYETIPNAPKYYETDRNISLGSNGADSVCLLRKKSRRDFVPRTFALIAPLHPVFHRVSCSYEKIPNAPEHYKMHQNMSLGPMDWIRCVGCEKFQSDFVAQTFALIAPVQYVLQQVSCSYETIPKARTPLPSHVRRLACHNRSVGYTHQTNNFTDMWRLRSFVAQGCAIYSWV